MGLDVFYWTILYPGALSLHILSHGPRPCMRVSAAHSLILLHSQHVLGEKLGIFWDVRDDTKGCPSRKSKRL